MTKLAVIAVLIGAVAGCDDDGADPEGAAASQISAPEMTLAEVGAGAAIAAAVADFNGDRANDLAVLSASATPGDGQPACLSIYTGPFANGLPTSSVRRYAIAPTASGLAAADLNGDGVPDLIIAFRDDALTNPPLPGRVHLLFLTADGRVRSENEILVGLDATSVQTADVNGDGITDIVTTGGGYTFVSLGQPGGTFRTPANIPGASHPATGDFNGDGRDDLAVATDADPTRVDVYRWDGTLGLVLAGSTSFDASVTALKAADVNGDGKVDLVAGLTDGLDAANGSVAVAAGDGNFTFASPRVAASGPASLIAVGNLNGDGSPDLAYFTAAASTVRTLFGSSSGAYGSGNPHPVPSGAADLKVADLDGDGMADMIVCTEAVRIFLSR